MKLATTLTALLKKRGLSLTALARLSGVPKQTIHHWTIGRKSVNPDQLKSVATSLEVSVHYLLYCENDPFEGPTEEILKEIFAGDVRVTLHRIEKRKRTT